MLKSLRYCAGLAWDAAEALLYSLNTNRAADVLWASTRTDTAARLVEKEAGEEVAEPQRKCDCGLSDDLLDLDKHAAICNVWADVYDDEQQCDSVFTIGSVNHRCQKLDGHGCHSSSAGGFVWTPAPSTPAGGEAPTLPADAPPSQTFPTAGQPNIYPTDLYLAVDLIRHAHKKGLLGGTRNGYYEEVADRIQAHADAMGAVPKA